MSKRFVQFLEALPNDKLTALAKPAAPGQQRAAYVQLVLDKFGVLGWEKLLERLDTTTLQQMGRELSVGSAEHDDRQYYLKNIPSAVADKTHETIKTFSTELLDSMWADLDISGELELEMIILELFIGGIEAIIGIFTIPQMNDVIDAFQINTQGKRKKEELVFDIVLSILDKTFVAPVSEVEPTSTVPQTPRSPIRPADDRPVRRRPAAASATPVAAAAAPFGRGKKVVSSNAMDVDDKENGAENDVSTAVAQLKFEPTVPVVAALTTRARRSTRAQQ